MRGIPRDNVLIPKETNYQERSQEPHKDRARSRKMNPSKGYTKLPGLENLYLEEDNYVLSIKESSGVVSFKISAVLTPQHPRYKHPSPDQQNCVETIDLIFDKVERIAWVERNDQVYSDPSGETDLGIIYNLTYTGDHYGMSGDFGEVHIHSVHTPRVEYPDEA
jgi:hypothetical protein